MKLLGNLSVSIKVNISHVLLRSLGGRIVSFRYQRERLWNFPKGISVTFKTLTKQTAKHFSDHLNGNTRPISIKRNGA